MEPLKGHGGAKNWGWEDFNINRFKAFAFNIKTQKNKKFP